MITRLSDTTKSTLSARAAKLAATVLIPAGIVLGAAFSPVAGWVAQITDAPAFASLSLPSVSPVTAVLNASQGFLGGFKADDGGAGG